MYKTIEVNLPPEEAFNDQQCRPALHNKLRLPATDFHLRMLRRSVDARAKKIQVNFLVEVVPVAEMHRQPKPSFNYRDVSRAPHALIVGAGPAGMFCALRLIELGVKPVILERGKDVQARRRDIAAINKEHLVSENSNYCFGEGGAGTYSDGKLYTRSKKRGDIRRILDIMVQHGARDEILFDAHPHIGTNKLPLLVAALRKTIMAAGGEIHFNTQVTDVLLQGDAIKGVLTHDGQRWPARAVVLATGHSARDVYRLLHERGIAIEAKPFALGVRVEHAQAFIDKVQYHCADGRGPYLPASSYALVQQVNMGGRQRGVFSFCMCPGGFIVPAATAPGEVVVNGMSPSRRDSQFANSGIVVAIEPRDFKGFEKYGPLAGMCFQQHVEQRACTAAGGTQAAPAQLLADFVARKKSAALLPTSYQPGFESVMMDDVLPGFLSSALREGFKGFERKIKGYITNEAQIAGVESRTSSPVRIPRDTESLQHIQIRGLFPCAEGAGYAGGIMSAAMDGERCAEAVLRFLAI
jgi:hypothetical protein